MHIGLFNKQFGKKVKWRPLPPGSVTINPGFWKKRQERNRKAGLAHGHKMLEQDGNLDNMRIAAGRTTGTYRGKVFWDSDIYKWLEAIAYELAKEEDEQLRQWSDEAIELIEAAQEENGYIETYYQIAAPEERWRNMTNGHELYCAGHLFEAAVAWNRFLNDGRLLKVAVRFADNIDSYFGPGKQTGTGGHPEVELALVELYRETGEVRYLNMAKYFIDQRGKGLLPPGNHGGHGGPAVSQDHVPVREATTVEGHAVRQLYLTNGVTDLYTETGETHLLDAVLRLWEDAYYRKMFITGGLGSRHTFEAFSEPYELPTGRAYSETCAAIAGIIWNWRLLMLFGDGRYSDIMEHTLYNGFLSGVSLSGDRYFYVNPLSSSGTDPAIGRKRIERMEWPWTPCCPPNIMRTLAVLDHFIATTGENGLQIHQFISSTLRLGLEDGRHVVLTMESDFPWNGEVEITIDKMKQAGQGGSATETWPLMVRLPGWSTDTEITINGRHLDNHEIKSGYAVIHRAWQEGDTLRLAFPMQPNLLVSHPYIDATRDSCALQRGPLLYCLEQVDQDENIDIKDVFIDELSPLTSRWDNDTLGGVVFIEAEGYRQNTQPWNNKLYRVLGDGDGPSFVPVELKAVPYYSWANRGPNAMRVWIPRAHLR